MRLAEFHRLVADEFGADTGKFYLSSHIVSGGDQTPLEMIENGVDLREIWWALCRDFEVPKERWLGEDI
ncbi:DUF3046 domain-containing protein [Corynebacterium epidermidicanis]|nr:DUF3046 domain-containing protein [Corynebacterium epidermidicanis]